jgi:hypothetical protein
MRHLRSMLRHEVSIAVALSAIAFSVYLQTICPTVSFTDSGELATVAVTLGIGHPTGYPLFTTMAHLASMVPVATDPIVRLNVFASFLTAVSVGLMFRLLLTIFRSRKLFALSTGIPEPIRNRADILGAATASLVFAFASTVWSQSVEIEVYALHLVMLILTTTLFVRGMEDQLTEPRTISRTMLLFSFVLGLSFSNHMTTILLAPAFLFLFFRIHGFGLLAWKRIVQLSPLFVLGLSFYFYLPIRSVAGAALDWGHPATLERFWWHITGKQYQTWMFAGSEVAKKQLNYFISNFSSEFHWAFIPVVFVGIVEIFVSSKRLFFFLILLFIACLGYTVNYDIHEIDPYFILAYVACGIAVGIGLRQLLVWTLPRAHSNYTVAIVMLLVFLPLLQLWNNLHDVDQSENRIVKDFTQNVFGSVEPNAVIFSSLWDYFVSPAYYFQIVGKMRPDISVIDKSLLQNRVWYLMQLERREPAMVSRSRVKLGAFQRELDKFEKGTPFQFSEIQARWTDLLFDLVDKSVETRPVYVDPRIEGEFSKEFDRVPQGLMVRLVKRGETASYEPISLDLDRIKFSNYVTEDLKKYYVAMSTYHGIWLASRNRPKEALDALKKGLRVDPAFPAALALRTQLTFASR